MRHLPGTEPRFGSGDIQKIVSRLAIRHSTVAPRCRAERQDGAPPLIAIRSPPRSSSCCCRPPSAHGGRRFSPSSRRRWPSLEERSPPYTGGILSLGSLVGFLTALGISARNSIEIIGGASSISSAKKTRRSPERSCCVVPWRVSPAWPHP